MASDPKFTHIAVERTDRRKIRLLASVLGQDIYALIHYWAETEWKQAVKVGLVKDSMLQSGEKATKA